MPLFVAAIDVLSVASGPTSRLLDEGTARVDALSFDLPAWGDAGSAGHLGFSDAFFLALFAAWAWRFGLRRGGDDRRPAARPARRRSCSASRSTAAIPALPFVAAGYLLPNLDRLVARERSGA